MYRHALSFNDTLAMLAIEAPRRPRVRTRRARHRGRAGVGTKTLGATTTASGAGSGSPSTTWNGSSTRTATVRNWCRWTNSPRTRTGISCSPNPYATGLIQSPSGPGSQNRVRQQQQAANGYNERGCDVLHRRRHCHDNRHHHRRDAHLLRNYVEGMTTTP